MVRNIFLKLSLRHSRKHPLQSALLILGIALGVAVIVAIDLANTSVGRSFRLSTESVSGKTTHHIVGVSSGVDQSIYTDLRVRQHFRACAPVIEGTVYVEEFNFRAMTLLGIDPFAESGFRNIYYGNGDTYYNTGNNVLPEKILVSLMTKPCQVMVAAAIGKKFGLRPGRALTLNVGAKRVSTQILSFIESRDKFMNESMSGIIVTDISTAQELLGMKDRISRIDLVIDPARIDTLDSIRKNLPPGVDIIESETRNNTVRSMSKSFETNLTAMSMLALLVGMFLIYNTVTFSVIQRRPLMGTLRALGVTRREIFFMVLTETFFLGLAGTLLGLILGVFMGIGSVSLVSRTISDLYYTLTVNDFGIAPSSLVKGAVTGFMASLLSALVPALEAAKLIPAEVLRRSVIEKSMRRMLPLLSISGTISLVIGTMLLWIPSKRLDIGFAGVFGIVFGCALLVPALTLGVVNSLKYVMGSRANIIVKMASGNIIRSLSRSGVAIASLMVAVSVIVGIGTMVGSFRQTVVNWLTGTMKADVYIVSPDRITRELDPGLLESLRMFPEITSMHTMKSFHINSGKFTNTLVYTVSEDFSDRTWIWKAGDTEYVHDLFEKGWVFVSEPFIYKYGIEMKQGALINLNTDNGPRDFRIAGVFKDFASSQGSVLMAYDVFGRFWKDIPVSGIALFLEPGCNIERLVDNMHQALSEKFRFMISSNRSIRNIAIEVFDRTFTITVSLQILAALVAFIGILNTVLCLMLERMREIGILRANGMTIGQLWGLILAESGLTGLIAGIYAMGLGTILAWILVFIINKRSFGWTLEFLLQFRHYFQAMAVSVGAALLAGIYPAFRAGKTMVADALRME